MRNSSADRRSRPLVAGTPKLPPAPAYAVGGRRLALALAGVVLANLAVAPVSFAAPGDLADVRREVAARHDEAVKRLQDWIALPSIAAENLNFPVGAEHMA